MDHYGLTVTDGELIINPAIDSGTAFPTPPNPYALFFRTDEDILYIRNHANTEWLDVGGNVPISEIFNWMEGNTGAFFPNDPHAYGVNSLAIGDNASVYGTDSIGIGTDVDVTVAWNENALVIGKAAQSTANSSIVIGEDAKATKRGTIAIGWGAEANDTNCIVMGRDAVVEAADNVAVLLRSVGGALRLKNDGVLEISSNGGTDWTEVAYGEYAKYIGGTQIVKTIGPTGDFADIEAAQDYWQEYATSHTSEEFPNTGFVFQFEDGAHSWPADLNWQDGPSVTFEPESGANPVITVGAGTRAASFFGGYLRFHDLTFNTTGCRYFISAGIDTRIVVDTCTTSGFECVYSVVGGVLIGYGGTHTKRNAASGTPFIDCREDGKVEIWDDYLGNTDAVYNAQNQGPELIRCGAGNVRIISYDKKVIFKNHALGIDNYDAGIVRLITSTNGPGNDGIEFENITKALYARRGSRYFISGDSNLIFTGVTTEYDPEPEIVGDTGEFITDENSSPALQWQSQNVRHIDTINDNAVTDVQQALENRQIRPPENAITKTVGPTGDFATFDEAWTWLSQYNNTVVEKGPIYHAGPGIFEKVIFEFEDGTHVLGGDSSPPAGSYKLHNGISVKLTAENTGAATLSVTTENNEYFMSVIGSELSLANGLIIDGNNVADSSGFWFHAGARCYINDNVTIKNFPDYGIISTGASRVFINDDMLIENVGWALTAESFGQIAMNVSSTPTIKDCDNGLYALFYGLITDLGTTTYDNVTREKLSDYGVRSYFGGVIHDTDDQTPGDYTQTDEYDNTISGLTATNEKAAIDELAATKMAVADTVPITKTVGGGGDFATVDEAFEWVNTFTTGSLHETDKGAAEEDTTIVLSFLNGNHDTAKAWRFQGCAPLELRSANPDGATIRYTDATPDSESFIYVNNTEVQLTNGITITSTDPTPNNYAFFAEGGLIALQDATISEFWGGVGIYKNGHLFVQEAAFTDMEYGVIGFDGSVFFSATGSSLFQNINTTALNATWGARMYVLTPPTFVSVTTQYAPTLNEVGEYGSWIVDSAGPLEWAAPRVSYDNTASGLTSDNVKDAIDELALGGIITIPPAGFTKTIGTGGDFANIGEAHEWYRILNSNSSYSDYTSISVRFQFKNETHTWDQVYVFAQGPTVIFEKESGSPVINYTGTDYSMCRFTNTTGFLHQLTINNQSSETNQRLLEVATGIGSVFECTTNDFETVIASIGAGSIGYMHGGTHTITQVGSYTDGAIYAANQGSLFLFDTSEIIFDGSGTSPISSRFATIEDRSYLYMYNYYETAGATVRNFDEGIVAQNGSIVLLREEHDDHITFEDITGSAIKAESDSAVILLTGDPTFTNCGNNYDPASQKNIVGDHGQRVIDLTTGTLQYPATSFAGVANIIGDAQLTRTIGTTGDFATINDAMSFYEEYASTWQIDFTQGFAHAIVFEFLNEAHTWDTGYNMFQGPGVNFKASAGSPTPTIDFTADNVAMVQANGSIVSFEGLDINCSGTNSWLFGALGDGTVSINNCNTTGFKLLISLAHAYGAIFGGTHVTTSTAIVADQGGHCIVQSNAADTIIDTGGGGSPSTSHALICRRGGFIDLAVYGGYSMTIKNAAVGLSLSRNAWALVNEENGTITFEDCDTAIQAVEGSRVVMKDSLPTFTNCTVEYSPMLSTTSGDGSMIIDSVNDNFHLAQRTGEVQITKTVGSTGDFATINDAMDWYEHFSATTVKIASGNVPSIIFEFQNEAHTWDSQFILHQTPNVQFASAAGSPQASISFTAPELSYMAIAYGGTRVEFKNLTITTSVTTSIVTGSYNGGVYSLEDCNISGFAIIAIATGTTNIVWGGEYHFRDRGFIQGNGGTLNMYEKADESDLIIDGDSEPDSIGIYIDDGGYVKLGQQGTTSKIIIRNCDTGVYGEKFAYISTGDQISTGIQLTNLDKGFHMKWNSKADMISGVHQLTNVTTPYTPNLREVGDDGSVIMDDKERIQYARTTSDTANTTKTIGATGDFATIASAIDWMTTHNAAKRYQDYTADATSDIIFELENQVHSVTNTIYLHNCAGLTIKSASGSPTASIEFSGADTYMLSIDNTSLRIDGITINSTIAGTLLNQTEGFVWFEDVTTTGWDTLFTLNNGGYTWDWEGNHTMSSNSNKTTMYVQGGANMLIRAESPGCVYDLNNASGSRFASVTGQSFLHLGSYGAGGLTVQNAAHGIRTAENSYTELYCSSGSTAIDFDTITNIAVETIETSTTSITGPGPNPTFNSVGTNYAPVENDFGDDFAKTINTTTGRLNIAKTLDGTKITKTIGSTNKDFATINEAMSWYGKFASTWTDQDSIEGIEFQLQNETHTWDTGYLFWHGPSVKFSAESGTPTINVTADGIVVFSLTSSVVQVEGINFTTSQPSVTFSDISVGAYLILQSVDTTGFKVLTYCNSAWLSASGGTHTMTGTDTPVWSAGGGLCSFWASTTRGDITIDAAGATRAIYCYSEGHVGLSAGNASTLTIHDATTGLYTSDDSHVEISESGTGSVVFDTMTTGIHAKTGARVYIEDPITFTSVTSDYHADSPVNKWGDEGQFILSGTGPLTLDADRVDYDNSTSGATATDVQAALDELFDEKADHNDGTEIIKTVGSGEDFATIDDAMEWYYTLSSNSSNAEIYNWIIKFELDDGPHAWTTTYQLANGPNVGFTKKSGASPVINVTGVDAGAWMVHSTFQRCIFQDLTINTSDTNVKIFLLNLGSAYGQLTDCTVSGFSELAYVSEGSGFYLFGGTYTCDGVVAEADGGGVIAMQNNTTTGTDLIVDGDSGAGPIVRVGGGSTCYISQYGSENTILRDADAGILCQHGGVVKLYHTTQSKFVLQDITNAAIQADTDGTILLGDGDPTFTSVGSNYHADSPKNVVGDKGQKVIDMTTGVLSEEYDPTISGLSSTTVKTAIDELAAGKVDLVDDYDNLPITKTIGATGDFTAFDDAMAWLNHNYAAVMEASDNINDEETAVIFEFEDGTHSSALGWNISNGISLTLTCENPDSATLRSTQDNVDAFIVVENAKLVVENGLTITTTDISPTGYGVVAKTQGAVYLRDCTISEFWCCVGAIRSGYVSIGDVTVTDPYEIGLIATAYGDIYVEATKTLNVTNVTTGQAIGIFVAQGSKVHIPGTVVFTNVSNNYNTSTTANEVRYDAGYVHTGINDLMWNGDRASYDNSTSGLTATTVQDAIDEIVATIGSPF